MVTVEALESLYGWAARDGATGAPTGSGNAALVLPPPLRERLEAFARTSAPQECCGVGIGPPGLVAEFHPLPNVHETPVTRYEISAADQLRLHLRAEERGWDVTLVFHTHPATEAYPSATDVALAAWPDATYAIMSLAEADVVVRAYRIFDGVVDELAVQ